MTASDPALDALAAASAWLAANRKVALATVIRTWGSAPRPAGSQMAVGGDAAFVGSVSGGCVESAVIAEAAAALKDGRGRTLSFGVTNEQAWAAGLACGGTVEVHVEPLLSTTQRRTLDALVDARAQAKPAVLATPLDDGESRLLFPAAGSTDELSQAARTAARRDQSAIVEIAGRSWFLNVFNPPPELVLIGAVHIAQPLAKMAELAGYAVRIIDPRTVFATPKRFPGVMLTHEWPDEALAKMPLGARSALVALTHDPKLDDPALSHALRSPAFYIGALGSRKTHTDRLERLRTHGFSDAELARIRGPVGLDIGARSPGEIALSILAEMTKTLRKE